MNVVFVGKLYFTDLAPTHPIAPGGPPLGIWGGGNVPMPTPPIFLPGGEAPPGYWGGVAPPLPTHPIAPGGAPPGYWGGVAPPYPSHPIAPGGQPPYPSQGPGFPTHPIAPGGGGQPPTPSHPIFLPPTSPPQPPAEVWPPLPPERPEPKEGYYLAYVPGLGKWVYIPVDTTKPVPVPEPKA
jgi:hypothetical protein